MSIHEKGECEALTPEEKYILLWGPIRHLQKNVEWSSFCYDEEKEDKTRSAFNKMMVHLFGQRHYSGKY